jgi:hypothetical protein
MVRTNVTTSYCSLMITIYEHVQYRNRLRIGRRCITKRKHVAVAGYLVVGRSAEDQSLGKARAEKHFVYVRRRVRQVLSNECRLSEFPREVDKKRCPTLQPCLFLLALRLFAFHARKCLYRARVSRHALRRYHLTASPLLLASFSSPVCREPSDCP